MIWLDMTTGAVVQRADVATPSHTYPSLGLVSRIRDKHHLTIHLACMWYISWALHLESSCLVDLWQIFRFYVRT